MGEVHQILEGGRGDRGDVGVGDREPVEIQGQKTKRGDVLKIWPVIDFKTPQVGEFAEVLVLQGSDAEVAKAKCDQAAEVRQRLPRNGSKVAPLYCEILQPQQS